MNAPALPTAAQVVEFWRNAGADRWFEKDAAFDDEIRTRFLTLHEAAAAGKLTGWEQNAEGALALLILLDQFPRNMFRNDARTFATDPLARAIAAGALVRGFDAQVPTQLFLSAVRAFRESCRSGTLGRLLHGHGRRRPAEMGGNSRRHHPLLRPLPASQRCAWPRDHACGTSLPRRRRL
jgi:uncharacterized protein (DUF924 family)